MVSVLTKLLGDTNEKAIKKILPQTELVTALEPEIQPLDDAELRTKTEEFRERLEESQRVAKAAQAGPVQPLSCQSQLPR